MTSHSFKSSHDLIQSIIAKKYGERAKTQNVLKNETLERVLVEMFSDKCLPALKYGYANDNMLIIGTGSAGWASRFRLQKLDIIRRYNTELKSEHAFRTANKDNTSISASPNEKTLITHLIIKVSP